MAHQFVLFATRFSVVPHHSHAFSRPDRLADVGKHSLSAFIIVSQITEIYKHRDGAKGTIVVLFEVLSRLISGHVQRLNMLRRKPGDSRHTSLDSLNNRIRHSEDTHECSSRLTNRGCERGVDISGLAAGATSVTSILGWIPDYSPMHLCSFPLRLSLCKQVVDFFTCHEIEHKPHRRLFVELNLLDNIGSREWLHIRVVCVTNRAASPSVLLAKVLRRRVSILCVHR
mmetsp:Transcript_32958/g.71978  ORF Transcript_32958/g.71978 Transcript_32958/m.71978 type:complete len:228 (+) Transcript_32958:207-890(+)